jgi:hypothetical protein
MSVPCLYFPPATLLLWAGVALGRGTPATFFPFCGFTSVNQGASLENKNMKIKGLDIPWGGESDAAFTLVETFLDAYHSKDDRALNSLRKKYKATMTDDRSILAAMVRHYAQNQ